MGPDWTDEYFPDAGQGPGPAPPPAAPESPPGPPTEHPPLTTAHMFAANTTSFPMSSGAPRARAGLAVLMSAIGTGIGAALGGLQGAGAGFLITGAGRNLYRAQSGLGSNDSGDSAKSLTLGLLGLAAGGYLVYRCFAKKPRKNSDDDD